MTYALVAITHATLGGVYYTPSFTTSGAQPVWSRLTTTGLPSTEPDIFRVSYDDPLNVQYLGFGCTIATNPGTIYARNGGNWSKVMDTTIASTVTGVAIVSITWLWTNPLSDYGVYCIALTAESGLARDNYILKSLDYGASWSVMGVPVNITRYGGAPLNVIGNYIWMGARSVVSTRIVASADGGNNWDNELVAGGAASPVITIDPNNPSRCYVHINAAGQDLDTVAAPATITVNDTGYGGVSGQHDDDIYADENNAGYAVAINEEDIYYTVDSFTNSTKTELDTPTEFIHAITNFWNEGTTDLVFGTKLSGPGARIYHISSKTDTTVANRSGANTGGAPYADSIPEVGYVVEYGIWAGMPPASAGAYVYADEQGDITDIPDPDNLGIPMFGDRSSWRDYDADNDGAGTTLADYHAQDIQEDTPQRHAPWSVPAPAADYGIVSDGTKWVISSDEMALVGDLHDPVTLDADAALILDLQGAGGQEIGLDVQDANTVLAGPTAAPANEPTFRALVLSDLPAISLDDLDDVNTAGVADGDVITYDAGTSTWLPTEPVDTATLHEHIINEDHTAECDGAEDEFATLLAFRETSTAVYLNGLRQRLDTHYTEDAGLDGITFVTPPEADDELIIDYIVTWTDYQAQAALLLDSEDIDLRDTDDEPLADSSA